MNIYIQPFLASFSYYMLFLSNRKSPFPCPQHGVHPLFATLLFCTLGFLSILMRNEAFSKAVKVRLLSLSISVVFLIFWSTPIPLYFLLLKQLFFGVSFLPQNMIMSFMETYHSQLQRRKLRRISVYILMLSKLCAFSITDILVYKYSLRLDINCVWIVLAWYKYKLII